MTVTNLQHALVLIGPMGSGKSSVGKKLAKTLKREFIDTDREIVREHGAIAELFAQHGEQGFREIESAVVRSSLRSDAVVALGGGAVLHEKTRRAIKDHRVILLDVSESEIAKRLDGSTRPLLAVENPVAEWARIRAERWPVYEQLADVCMDTSRMRFADIVQKLAEWAKGQQ